jgi:hypothetical protein
MASLNQRFLRQLPSGAEAAPFADLEHEVVYKLFDLRSGGNLGKKIALEPEPDGSFELHVRDAVLFETIEKIAVLHEAGALPTEIVGLADTGDYLIAKQPLAGPMQEIVRRRSLRSKVSRPGHLCANVSPSFG